MSKPQAKHSPPKASGSPPSAQVKSAPVVNKYLIGFSPRKPVKQEFKASDKNSHMFYLSSIRGGFFEIAYLEHARNTNDDGYFPHTVNLVRGGGTFQDRNDNIIVDERLADQGFMSVHFRRGPDGNTLTNVTVSRGVQWNRRVLLKCNTPEEIRDGRTDAQMIGTLATLCRVTVDLNTRVDVNSRVANNYAYAPPVHKKNPVDGEAVSLDFHMVDREVVAVLETYCTILSPTFAVDYPDAASVYFDPFRKTFPAEILKYGWVNDVTNRRDGNQEDDLERFRGGM